jgi:hypothetical protein
MDVSGKELILDFGERTSMLACGEVAWHGEDLDKLGLFSDSIRISPGCPSHCMVLLSAREHLGFRRLCE